MLLSPTPVVYSCLYWNSSSPQQDEFCQAWVCGLPRFEQVCEVYEIRLCQKRAITQRQEDDSSVSPKCHSCLVWWGLSSNALFYRRACFAYDHIMSPCAIKSSIILSQYGYKVVNQRITKATKQPVSMGNSPSLLSFLLRIMFFFFLTFCLSASLAFIKPFKRGSKTKTY